MNKKLISFFILPVFMVFTFSCYSIKTTAIIEKFASKNEKWGFKILAVEKKSGEKIEFSKDHPGEILDSRIIGESIDTEGERMAVSISLKDVKTITYKRKSVIKTFFFSLVVTYTIVFIFICIAFSSMEEGLFGSG
jgi:hypothetical protein